MASLSIEVVYALPSDEDAVTLSLTAGATAGEAVRASGVLERHPEIDLRHQAIGIHGRVVTAGTLLRDGDRVEIYRPLAVDPKEARRRRAFKKT
ncbi:MAG TPA: RnfH family protein [Burkholderiales bacterium]|nr:RnfH family protein [Burkholderiales bacterium]